MSGGGRLLTLDLHGCTVEQARKKLSHAIAALSPQYEGIYVIHGSNNGTSLLNYIRNGVKSPKIDYITPSLTNPGATTIYIKR